MTIRPRSEALFQRALELTPGGVNSPVRAWKTVGGTPIHVASGQGARCTDVDGNEYIDLVMSYGPLLFGHGHAPVIHAVREALERGTAFGSPTEGEVEMAERITSWVPGVERVRLVNSGTEATMSALRVARAATGRDHFVKLEGCYHGHGDSFLVKAGSGALTLGAPDSPGVPAALAEQTLIGSYNDADSVARLFEQHPSGIAAIFVEPVAGNMGTVPPRPGFLEALRELCDRHGALLIFDEVMSGFRVARGGYAERCGITPDLVTLGKVIGGGLPIAAYGGLAKWMNLVAPAGKVYQAGTLSGNPIAVAAGNAMLAGLEDPAVYERLERSGERLEAGFLKAAEQAGIPMTFGRVGSMLNPFFAAEPVHTFDEVFATDRKLWVRFFDGMLERGILMPPSPFEAFFLSTAHDDAVVDEIVEAARGTLQDLRSA